MYGLVANLRSIVPATEFVKAMPMCDALSAVVKNIGQVDPLQNSELSRLEETSMALHLCFHSGKTVSIITREITDAVAALGKRV